MVDEVVGGRLDLVLPEPGLSELRPVMTVKIGWEPSRWREREAFLLALAVARPAAPAAAVDAVSGDPADDVLLWCAVAASVDVLVTGDRQHLVPLGEHQGVRILTPQALLAELAAG